MGLPASKVLSFKVTLNKILESDKSAGIFSPTSESAGDLERATVDFEVS
jgi:hypothetical protein